MRRLLLALDQGTSSSRAMLFDLAGRSVAVAQRALAASYPRPGWVEQDAGAIWTTQLDCLREVVAMAGGDEIVGVGIANQRETTILWDRRDGEPVAPAIVWQDRRGVAACQAMREAGRGERLRALTGLEIDAYFSATKLAWLLANTPAVRQRAERGELCFGTVDSWLIFKLTGGARHVTDASNASRTLLFNLHTGDWDDELLTLFDIPRALLPEVVPSSGVLGYCDPRWAGRALPIAGVAGDQQAATFGQACFNEGMAKNTYGTGCFLMRNAGAVPPVSTQRLLSTLAWRIDGAGGGRDRYALEGSVFMGGAIVQWLRDGLGMIASAAEVEPLAASVPDPDGVVLVPAFTGLGAPYWDGEARGLLIGLTRGSGRAHIARAALDAIALQTVDLVEAMNRDLGAPLTLLRVDGGASRNNLLMQRQADLLGVPVLRPAQVETTALGAAWLAGLALGCWASEDELATLWRLERCFEPALSADQRAATLDRWHRAVARCRHWAPAA